MKQIVLLVALGIAATLGIGIGVLAEVPEFWPIASLWYFLMLGVTAIAFALRGPGSVELYQFALRALWPLSAMFIVNGAVWIGGDTGLLLAIPVFLIGVMGLTAYYVVLAVAEIAVRIGAKVKFGENPIQNAHSLLESAHELMDRIYLRKHQMKIKLAPGEKILMVLHQSKWSSIYQKVFFSFARKAPIAGGAGFVLMTTGFVLDFIGKGGFSGIIRSGNATPINFLAPVLGFLLGFLLVQISGVVLEYVIQSWNHRRHLFVLTSIRTFLLDIEAPKGRPTVIVVPTASFEVIKIVPEGGTTEKSAISDQIFDTIAGFLTGTARIQLPNQNFGGMAEIDVDGAANTALGIDAIAALARDFRDAKSVFKTTRTRADLNLAAEMVGSGASTLFGDNGADPQAVTEAWNQYLKDKFGEDIPLQEIDLWEMCENPNQPIYWDRKTGTAVPSGAGASTTTSTGPNLSGFEPS